MRMGLDVETNHRPLDALRRARSVPAHALVAIRARAPALRRRAARAIVSGCRP
jgi:hypothetical protein